MYLIFYQAILINHFLPHPLIHSTYKNQYSMIMIYFHKYYKVIKNKNKVNHNLILIHLGHNKINNLEHNKTNYLGHNKTNNLGCNKINNLEHNRINNLGCNKIDQVK